MGKDSKIAWEKCAASPYYFMTKYWKVEGKPFTTLLSEDDFNKEFNRIEKVLSIKYQNQIIMSKEKYEKVHTLNRADLHRTRDNVKNEEVIVYDFKNSSLSHYEMIKADLITFTGDDGVTRRLKDKWKTL